MHEANQRILTGVVSIPGFLELESQVRRRRAWVLRAYEAGGEKFVAALDKNKCLKQIKYPKS